MLNISNKIGLACFQEHQQGAQLKRLTFICGEVLSVGQINEPLASSFEVIEGVADFSVDNSGNITFNSLPDYDTQRTYNLKIRSNRNRTYVITVYVTIFLSDYLTTGNEYIYDDTYIAA